jgi:hypothetical protein
LNRPACPLDRAHGHDTVIVTREDVKSLRTAAQRKKGAQQVPGFSDGLLFYAANSELCSTVSLAWCHDPQDQDLYAQQERFKRSYANFRKTIAGLSSSNLRYSVELPDNYVRSIEDNWLLNYAQPREGGRPVEWRRDEFFVRVLTLYKLFSGEHPAGTEDGPAVRFMREVINILRRFLATTPDTTTERYRLVDALWRLPRNGTFLKEWFRTKGGTIDIQRQVDCYADACVAAYERQIAAGPDRGQVIYGAFGGEKPGS